MHNSLCLLLFGLVACLLSIDSSADCFSVHTVTTPALWLSIITILCARLYKKVSTAVFVCLGEFLMMICLIDTFCQESFGSSISPRLLSIVLNTNMLEAGDFFSSYIDWLVLTKWKIVSLLTLIISYPFFFCEQLRTNTERRLSFFKERKCYRYMLWMTLILLCFVEVSPTFHFIQLLHPANSTQQTESFIFRHYHEELPTPLHRLAYSCAISRQSWQTLEQIKQSTFEARVDRCTYRSPHIVLVIGESYNKHHSQLYGYQYGTTPNQYRRRDEEDLFVYSDVITPWNITSNVFLSLFSLWNCLDSDDIGQYPLFPFLFKQSGYEVNFFSNQYVTHGLRKGSTNQAGSFFLSDKELCDSLFSYRNEKAYLFDMGLIERIEPMVMRQRINTLDIIHLIGQHFDYYNRYPAESAQFGENHVINSSLEERDRRIVADYDNATFYNDMVLEKILSIYEQENAIVIFVSDHGEEVYDDLPVHGRLFQEPTSQIAKNEYEVPMWIWCSDLYRQGNPEIVEAIAHSVDRPYLTDDLPFLLLYLAGIDCQYMKEERNILSPFYKSKKRILAGSVDYDILRKEN